MQRFHFSGHSYVARDEMSVTVTSSSTEGVRYQFDGGVIPRHSLPMTWEQAIEDGWFVLSEEPDGDDLVTLEHCLSWMAVHAAENPTHGFNCACKDRALRAARRLVTKPEIMEEFRYLAMVLLRS